MGFFSKIFDDILGFDPNGGGIYSVARDVLGDKIADDILGMDPNGGGAIDFYNVALPAVLGAYAIGYVPGVSEGAGAGASSAVAGVEGAASQAALTAYESAIASGATQAAAIAAADAAVASTVGATAGLGVDAVATLGTNGAAPIVESIGTAVNGGMTPTQIAGASSLIPGVSNNTLLSAGSSLLGNYLGNRELSSGIEQAARINQQTTDKILALQQPWITAGTDAVNRLAAGLAPGGEFATPFSQTDWQQDPGYQFRLSEGLKALDRQMTSRGSLLSGGALKGTQRYAQELASQEFPNAFNRYYTERTNMLAPIQSLAGLGQTNVGQASNALTAGSTNAGNAALTGGALQASQYGSIGNLVGRMFA